MFGCRGNRANVSDPCGLGNRPGSQSESLAYRFQQLEVEEARDGRIQLAAKTVNVGLGFGFETRLGRGWGIGSL